MRAAALLLCAIVLAGAARAEPDADLLGQAQGYPLGNAATFFQPGYRVGSWSALDRVPGVLVRRVPAPAAAQPLPRSTETADIRYRYRNLEYTLQDYLERQRTTGLL